MASLFKRNARWSIQFAGADGRRPIIRLGKVSEKTARSIQTHVERLVNASIDRQPVTRDTAEWLTTIGASLHAKLVKAGLTEPRRAVVTTQLADYLDAYIKGRTDLKERSRANLTQARNGLVKHFGKKRDLKTITKGEAQDWHRGIKARLSKATTAGHVKRARMFFADAVNRNLIAENPFRGIKAGSMANRERFFYVPIPTIESVLAACPDAEWRLIFALARFGGLRVPSESNALRWGDVDWERHRITVRSSKTAHHAGGGMRVVPIFPELLPYLEEAYHQAAEGEKFAIVKHRGENLRTTGEKIVTRAGIDPWGKLFQNLRSSCETDLTTRFPLHVACAWVGNSEAVASKHYLQVTDDHFDIAIGKSAAKSAAISDQNGAKGMAAKRQNPAFLRGLVGNTYPQGDSNSPAKIAELLGVKPEALRKALRRLKAASPYIYEAEKMRLRAALGRGGVSAD